MTIEAGAISGENYIGFIESDTIYNQYPLIFENRVDKRAVIRKRMIGDIITRYETINHYKSEEANEKKGVKDMGNALLKKMEAKKQNGIMQQTVELSAQKLVMAEEIKKTIAQVSALVMAQNEKISAIENDINTIANILKNNGKILNENNTAIASIATQLTSIQSIQKVSVKKADINGEAKQTEHVNITKGNIDYTTAYNHFLNGFASPFMGSKKADHLVDFIGLYNAIDWTTADSIESSIRAHWTKRRSEDNIFMWGAPQMNKAIKALLAIVSLTPADTSKSSGPVIDSAYWIKHFGITQADLNDFIDLAKAVPIGNEEAELIKGHLIEIASKHATHETERFIEWLKAYNK